jgi:hypothetical protein
MKAVAEVAENPNAIKKYANNKKVNLEGLQAHCLGAWGLTLLCVAGAEVLRQLWPADG